jgi:hypothetical protein
MIYRSVEKLGLAWIDSQIRPARIEFFGAPQRIRTPLYTADKLQTKMTNNYAGFLDG